MKDKNLDHLRHRSDGTFLCEHCGDKYQMNLPASINMVLAIMKSWKNSHKNCKKRENNENTRYTSETPEKANETHN